MADVSGLDSLFGFGGGEGCGGPTLCDSLSDDSQSVSSSGSSHADRPSEDLEDPSETPPPALDGLFGVAQGALDLLSPMSAACPTPKASVLDRLSASESTPIPSDVEKAVHWLLSLSPDPEAPAPSVSDLIATLSRSSASSSSSSPPPAFLPLHAAALQASLCPTLTLNALNALLTPGCVWSPVLIAVQHVCSAADPTAVRCARPLAAAIRINVLRLTSVLLAAATSSKANSSRAASSLAKVLAAVTRALDVLHGTCVLLGSVFALRKGIPGKALLYRVTTAHEALTMSMASLGQILAGPSGAAAVVEGQDTVHPFPGALPQYDDMLAQFQTDRKQLVKCFNAREKDNISTIIRGNASVLVRQVEPDSNEYVVTFQDEASRVTQVFPVVNCKKTDTWKLGAAFARHRESGLVDVMPPDSPCGWRPKPERDVTTPTAANQSYTFLDDLLSDIHQLQNVYKRDDAYLLPIC